MTELKASEVFEAIENDAFVVDLKENQDAIVLIQDAKDSDNVKVNGYVSGDDERLSILLADRMVKDKDFERIIRKAILMTVNYRLQKITECTNELMEKCCNKESE